MICLINFIKFSHLIIFCLKKNGGELRFFNIKCIKLKKKLVYNVTNIFECQFYRVQLTKKFLIKHEQF